MELKVKLGKRGLLTDGLKAELMNWLQAWLDKEEFSLVEPSTSSMPNAASAGSPTLAPAAPTTADSKRKNAATASATSGKKGETKKAPGKTEKPAEKSMAALKGGKSKDVVAGLPVVQQGEDQRSQATFRLTKINSDGQCGSRYQSFPRMSLKPPAV